MKTILPTFIMFVMALAILIQVINIRHLKKEIALYESSITQNTPTWSNVTPSIPLATLSHPLEIEIHGTAEITMTPKPKDSFLNLTNTPIFTDNATFTGPWIIWYDDKVCHVACHKGQRVEVMVEGGAIK